MKKIRSHSKKTPEKNSNPRLAKKDLLKPTASLLKAKHQQNKLGLRNSQNSTKSQNLIYKPNFVSSHQKQELLTWLSSLHPIWENRFSKNNPPPEGSEQRQLLRPVYWLGNWQFACLNYFHPPKNLYNCCVEAEVFPPILQDLANLIENEAHSTFPKKDIPHGWHFNTCLVNFYGHSIDAQNKKTDTARVGEHRDFEPGPVGSISLGERALFQFVDSPDRGSQSHVVLQQWLDDSSLQVFAGDRFKKKLFHRVQRVDHKTGKIIGPNINNFETRRINFTFRYVPNEFIVPFHHLPLPQQQDIKPYIEELSLYAPFFKKVLTNPTE